MQIYNYKNYSTIYIYGVMVVIVNCGSRAFNNKQCH